MTQTLAPEPSRSRSLESTAAKTPSRMLRSPVGAGRRQISRANLGGGSLASNCSARAQRRRDALGCYRDPFGRSREVIARRRADGCVLVVDRDAQTRGDGRLVAQIAAEEPVANATLVCGLYLRDPRRGCCRRVTVEDLTARTPPQQDEESCQHARGVDVSLRHGITTEGEHYGIELLRTDLAARELRWCRRQSHGSSASVPLAVCLREVIGAAESYQPALAITRQALSKYRMDANVSTAVLRAELERLSGSPIVLNRELRRKVLAAVEHRGVSLSEIAIRCGRVKRDPKGNMSGETSWLARRVGMLPESGSGRRTPWIHSDVLALIARNGLGISPREVELA
jgi:hypothetical protein